MDLVHAARSLILSRKDYTNSLLRKVNVTDIQKNASESRNRAGQGYIRQESASPLIRQYAVVARVKV